jgi:hypothetical protein
MCKMKYVLNRNSGRFLLFPEFVGHSSVNNIGADSAGFLNLGFERDECKNPIPIVSCFGNSVSLKLTSHSEDSEIITRALRIRF